MPVDRILYFTDVHYGVQPINRKDNYNLSILSKVEQLFKYADENQCVVVMGGDIFDSYKIPFVPLIQFISLLRKYPKVKKYSVIGNHDKKGEVSPLELIASVDLIRCQRFTVDLNGVRIIFSHYGELDTDKQEEMISPHHFNILATHENITKKSFIGDHVLMADYKTSADMVLVAHYHPDQGFTKRADGKYFIAPGALARQKRLDHEQKRIPQAADIRIEDGVVKVKRVIVECEMDVWKEKTFFDVVENFSVYSNEINTMKNIIGEQVFTDSIEDAMCQFAKENKIDSNVLEYCKEELSKL